MAQVLVRNIDEATVKILKQRAKRHGRSLSAEVKTIIQDAAGSQTDWRQQVEQVRAMFDGRSFSDSAEIVREDRDR